MRSKPVRGIRLVSSDEEYDFSGLPNEDARTLVWERLHGRRIARQSERKWRSRRDLAARRPHTSRAV